MTQPKSATRLSDLEASMVRNSESYEEYEEYEEKPHRSAWDKVRTVLVKIGAVLLILVVLYFVIGVVIALAADSGDLFCKPGQKVDATNPVLPFWDFSCKNIGHQPGR